MNLGWWNKCFAILAMAMQGHGMFSKRPLPEDRLNLPKEKRLRSNMGDLYLSNEVSGQRTQTLMDDAHDAGVQGFRRLAATPSASSTGKNLARNLRRKLVKGHWPKPYYARVRVWNKQQQREMYSWLAITLPHEILAIMYKYNIHALDKLLQTSNMSASTLANFAAVKRELQEDRLVGMSFWCDGCPANWDRTESIEVWALSFPGIPEFQALRLPITVISKKYCIGEHTFDDILEILAWSMKHCAGGIFPSCRHDMSSFGIMDAGRQKKAGQQLAGGICAALCEVRGDWKMMKEVFRLPGWADAGGCCSKCRACPSDIRDNSQDALWRQQPLDHWDLLERMQTAGKSLCAIYSCPGFRKDMFQLDWLHAVDKGVASSFLGNLLWMILPKLQGPNKTEKIKTLFLKMKAFYRTHGSTDKYGDMKLTMIKQDGKGPKLRGGAAEVRALVPFGRLLAEEYLSPDVPEEQAALTCARLLEECYNHLSHQYYNPAALDTACRLFCVQYCALEAWAGEGSKLWRVKPKLHVFAHLCSPENGLPSKCWTYRDEDFGGTMSRMSRRRGGPNTVLSTSKNVLLCFFAKHSVPLL